VSNDEAGKPTGNEDALKAFFPPEIDVALMLYATKQLVAVLAAYDAELQDKGLEPILRVELVRDMARHLLTLGRPA